MFKYYTKYFVGYINTNPNLPKKVFQAENYTIGQAQFQDILNALVYMDDLEATNKHIHYQYDLFELKKIT